MMASHKANVSGLAATVGCTRQALYKPRKARNRRAGSESLWLEFLRAQRRVHPRMGIAKVRHVYLGASGVAPSSVGRDWCFATARRYGLLASVPRRGRPRTTRSDHGFGYAPFLAKGMAPHGRNQLWVADLTYLRTRSGWAYLALLTNAYSRKIVGWHVSNSLEMAGCLAALRSALRDEHPTQGLVHHSDRGVQYACKAYRTQLRQHGLNASMTEWNHCYENAMAERVNGILKGEYLLDQTFDSLAQARSAVGQAVGLYNYRRPHSSINMNYLAIHHAS